MPRKIENIYNCCVEKDYLHVTYQRESTKNRERFGLLKSHFEEIDFVVLHAGPEIRQGE